MLTPEQVERYNTQGYVAVEAVVAMEEIEELRRVTEEFVNKSREATEHTAEFDLEPGHTPDDPRLRRLKAPEALHPAYDRIFRSDVILDMVAQLVGPCIRHFGGKLNMKAAGFGSPVEWHQDFAFRARANDDMLAVGVALDDMDMENGCLLVVPGSHRGPIYDHFEGDVFAGAITEPDFEPGKVVPIELRAGDISIHHGRMLHASAPNKTPDRPRRFYLLQYCAGDSWPLDLRPEEMDVFNAQMLRGETPDEARFTDLPEVPRPAQTREGKTGSIYEQQTHLQRRFFEETEG